MKEHGVPSFALNQRLTTKNKANVATAKSGWGKLRGKIRLGVLGIDTKGNKDREKNVPIDQTPRAMPSLAVGRRGSRYRDSGRNRRSEREEVEAADTEQCQRQYY